MLNKVRISSGNQSTGKLVITMSMDRNVWIYGTGLLVIVGGCFAIGYTLLPAKPAFDTKKVATVVAPIEPETQSPTSVTEVKVPKLVIEDITAEKTAETKSADQPIVDDNPSTGASPDELDISVDTSKKTESGEQQTETVPQDPAPKPATSEPDKSSQRKSQSKSNVVAEQPAKETKAPPTTAVDDSVVLFRVRIDAIKPTRKDAGALVSELKDKGFSATVLPLAGGFVVQTGAFRDRKSAETLQRTLLDNGYDASISN